MLIIDMPMPVKEWNCLDCKALCVDMLRHYCGITKKTIDTLKNMRARPDWCPIKGELVQCGECERREPDEEPQNDGKKYVWCKYWRVWKPEDGFCDVGRTKGENR